MTLTVFVMVLVIIWAIRNIIKELDIMGIARSQLHKKYDKNEDD